MLTLRLHLDACGPENGPLRVVPGSHRHGRLRVEEINAVRAAAGEIAVTANAGDLLVMRPLILHASSSSAAPSRRRVIHIEFAADALPGGLEWHTFQ